jgi:hypothetical protein
MIAKSGTRINSTSSASQSGIRFAGCSAMTSLRDADAATEGRMPI